MIQFCTYIDRRMALITRGNKTEKHQLYIHSTDVHIWNYHGDSNRTVCLTIIGEQQRLLFAVKLTSNSTVKQMSGYSIGLSYAVPKNLNWFAKKNVTLLIT